MPNNRIMEKEQKSTFNNQIHAKCCQLEIMCYRGRTALQRDWTKSKIMALLYSKHSILQTLGNMEYLRKAC